MKTAMKRARIVLFTVGLIAGLYGAVYDYEPVTLIGAFLVVVGLMLPVFRKSQKSEIVHHSNTKK